MAEPIETRSVTRRTVLKGDRRRLPASRTVPAIIAACSSSRLPAAAPSAAAPSAAPRAPPPSAAAPSAAHRHDQPRLELLGRRSRRPRCRRSSTRSPPKTGIAVTVNTVDHNDFQDQISSYLQGTPDDIFTWFAGYRMRFFADQGLADATSATSGRRSRQQLLRGLQGGVDGRRRQAVLHPVLQLPVGRHLPQEPVRGEGLHRPDDVGRVHRPGRQDEDRRPRPDGLRRQRRLAGDGHVRHPQHAPQRLRLPRRPDGRHAASGPTRRSRPSSSSGSELIPYLQEGALGRTWQDGAQSTAQRRGRDVLPGHVRGRAGDAEADRADLDFFPFPTLGTEFDAELGHRRADRRVHDAARHPARTRTPPRRSSSTSPRARPRSSSSRPARTAWPRPTTRTPSGYNDVPEEVGRDHRGPPARSPSSSTATPARTSPARTACRASCRPS